MKLVLQRVSSARVRHLNETRLEINLGILIFVGVESSDTRDTVEALARKVIDLRIFENPQGETTFTIKEAKGEFMVLPQPTLCADLSKGPPQEVGANASGDAKEIVDWYCMALSRVRPCRCGFLGLPMKLQINNEGPATYLLEM